MQIVLISGHKDKLRKVLKHTRFCLRLHLPLINAHFKNISSKTCTTSPEKAIKFS